MSFDMNPPYGKYPDDKPREVRDMTCNVCLDVFGQIAMPLNTPEEKWTRARDAYLCQCDGG